MRLEKDGGQKQSRDQRLDGAAAGGGRCVFLTAAEIGPGVCVTSAKRCGRWLAATGERLHESLHPPEQTAARHRNRDIPAC